MTYAPGTVWTYGLAALVAAPFLLLPGLPLAWGLGRRAGWSVAQVVAAAFAFGLAVTGVVSLVAHYAGLSLTFTVVASGVLFAAFGVAGILFGRGGKRLAPGWPGLALAGAAALLAVWEKPWFAQTADTFYHLAAVRSLLVANRPMVTDPFYGTSVTILDPTSGVWHTSLAGVSRLTGLDPAWLWPGATAVGAAMTVLGFWVLAKRVSGSEWAASVAALGLAAFPLALDMRWMAYPNRMSLAMVFVALAAVVDFIERPNLEDAALLVAAGFAAISLHLASAAVIVLAAGFIGLLLVAAVLVERVRSGEWEWRPVAGYAATGLVLALVSTAVILPKANVVAGSWILGYQADVLARQVQVFRNGWMIARPALFGDHAAVLLATALLGLAAAVPAFGRGDRRALAVTGICLLPVALFLDPPLSTWLLHSSFYLASRVAGVLRFPLYVGIAWGLAALAEARRDEPLRRLSAALAVAALAAGVLAGVAALRTLLTPDPANVSAFATSRASDIRATFGPRTLADAASRLATGYPVVAGDFETTYYLAGLMPVRVVAAPPRHAPFAIEARDGEARRKDVETLLDPHTPELVRREIVARRDVAYVVVSPISPPLQRSAEALRRESDLFRPLVVTPTFALFEVAR